MGLSRQRAQQGRALDSKTELCISRSQQKSRADRRGESSRSGGDRQLTPQDRTGTRWPVPGATACPRRACDVGGGLQSPGREVPGAVSCLGLWCWEPRGISNREGRPQLSKPSGQKPRDRLEVGAAGPGEEGDGPEGGGGRGPGEGGQMEGVHSDAGCAPGGGPTPWSVSGPALHPLASPITTSFPCTPPRPGSLTAPPAACPPWAPSEVLPGPRPEAHTARCLSGRPSCCFSLPGGESF